MKRLLFITLIAIFALIISWLAYFKDDNKPLEKIQERQEQKIEGLNGRLDELYHLIVQKAVTENENLKKQVNDSTKRNQSKPVVAPKK